MAKARVELSSANAKKVAKLAAALGDKKQPAAERWLGKALRIAGGRTTKMRTGEDAPLTDADKDALVAEFPKLKKVKRSMLGLKLVAA